MRTKLMAVLEWYAEATPQDRLEDNGQRALNLLTDMGKGGDEGDMLERLLHAVSGVLDDFAPTLESSLKNLQASAMEWQD